MIASYHQKLVYRFDKIATITVQGDSLILRASSLVTMFMCKKFDIFSVEMVSVCAVDVQGHVVCRFSCLMMSAGAMGNNRVILPHLTGE